jgi:hypothetical protein
MVGRRDTPLTDKRFVAFANPFFLGKETRFFRAIVSRSNTLAVVAT